MIHSRQSAMVPIMAVTHSPRQAKIPAIHETMIPISVMKVSWVRAVLVWDHPHLLYFYPTPLERSCHMPHAICARA